MILFINILFAWIATILMFSLTIIWVIRIAQKKDLKYKKSKRLKSISKFLRKKHISWGILFLIISYVHGRFSSFSVLSFNFGTLALIVGMLLWCTFSHRNSFGKSWIKRHRELTVLIIVLTVVHIVEVNGFVGFERIIKSVSSDFQSLKPLKDTAVGDLKDGEYIGIGYGYSPELKVSVKIQDGNIEDIKIISHNEVGEMFYLPAFENIPKSIIESQSIKVDVVSGATYSSNGIIEAVEDALNKAKKVD